MPIGPNPCTPTGSGRTAICVQRLELPESLDITAEAFANTARAVDGDVTIGASTVKRIDASGVQLLYAVVAAAKARGARVAWDSPTRTLIDAAKAAGLDRLLEL